MAFTARCLTIAVIAAAAANGAWAQTPPSVACTATTTYTIDGQAGGPGSWTRTAKRKCTIPGVWSDAPDKAAWTIHKSGKGALIGSVTFFGVQPPGCAATWPLVGSITNRKHFSVTATDPTGSNPSCVKTIEAVAAIQ